MKQEGIFLVDDDGEALLSLVKVLKSTLPNISIHAFGTAATALKEATTYNPLLWVIDLSLDSQGVESGFNLLQEILRCDATARVIVLTGHGTAHNGIRALKLGAANFLEKPANIEHLSALIQDGVKQAALRREFTTIEEHASNLLSREFIGTSKGAQLIREELHYAANTNQPLLILGETGTGKGLSASLVHTMSKRSKKKFVRFQPSFNSPELVNSELFGHRKGAFTGAIFDRSGLLHEAHGGTLFLDELDELPQETQIALLGALQERKFRALGSDKEDESDFRLIAAFNKPVETVLKSGKLREDLFHRIAHLTIKLPPLRERLEDISILADSFITSLQETEQLSVRSIDKDAIALLKSHSWPGNIRELHACIEDAAYRANFKEQSVISQHDVRLKRFQEDAASTTDFKGQLDALATKLILDALAAHSGNQVQAAAALGISRTTLRKFAAK